MLTPTPARRPGIWVANGTPTDAVKMLSWAPGSLTSFYDYLGPNQVIAYKRDHPDIPVIIRFQQPRDWEHATFTSARNLANLVVSKWPVLQEIDPYVYFANEVNLHYENGDDNPANQIHYETPEFYSSYADWVRMTADHIKDQVPQMRLVCPPFAFGHHEDGAPDDDGNPKDGWAGYDYLADTIQQYFDNILTFHGYWGNAAGCVPAQLHHLEISTWYAFRWRRLLKLFETRYGINARVIIDEAGNMDASHPDFTNQAIYYARQCLADDRVIALTYFLWEDPTHHAGNVINSWVQRIPDLDSHTRRLAAMPDVALPDLPDPPTDRGPMIRVRLSDDTILALPMEEYLRGVVPAEMPALWPMEALKAQAIAARTYATYALNRRGHRTVEDPVVDPACGARGADIGATTATQVYNSALIHARSDQAVADTAGMLILYDGEVPCDVPRGVPIQAFYSANCGGSTITNDKVWPGEPRPYLQPTTCANNGPKDGHRVGMCQWGAHDMAKKHSNYETILHHYYTDVTISPRIDRGVSAPTGGN